MENAVSNTLDIRRLITDLGGPARVHDIIGGSRATPYRWAAGGVPSFTSIRKLLSRARDRGITINLGDYLS